MEEDSPETNIRPARNVLIDLRPDGTYTIEEPVIGSEPTTVDTPPVIIDVKPLYPTDRDVVEAQIRAAHPDWTNNLVSMSTNDILVRNRILNSDIKGRTGKK